MILFSIFVFCFGVIIGSFLNVVILRYNTGLSISHGRSQCFSCGKTLSWKELLPIVSFVIQGGKCKWCKSNISWQYSLVELVTGLLFLFSYLRADLSSYWGVIHLILIWAIFSLFVVITAYDFRHKIIPNVFSFTFSGLALAQAFILNNNFTIPDLSVFIAGPILALFFIFIYWAWFFFTKQEGIGLGDAKLALGIGWFLGLSSGTASVFLAFWLGTIISLTMIGIQRLFGKKSLGMKSAIPFGPFLILSLILCFFLSIDMLTIASWLSFGL